MWLFNDCPLYDEATAREGLVYTNKILYMDRLGSFFCTNQVGISSNRIVLFAQSGITVDR